MRRAIRLATVALVAAPLAGAAAPASAECVLVSQPPNAGAVVCVQHDPNIDWSCRVGVGQLYFVCPT